MSEKTPKIFISHSSKDLDYVIQIVTLLENMGLDQTQVFCSSLPGYGIQIGEDIFDTLRTQFSEHNLHVIKSADWVIDMGPEGGLKGGQVVAEGTPEDLARSAKTPTGEYLRKYLK